MGCDIHLKLEKRANKTLFMETFIFGEDGRVTRTEVVPRPTWKGYYDWYPVSLTSKNCWGDRVYGMFARLAGVRDYGENSSQIVPSRGFPNDACNDTKTAYSYIVISDEDYQKDKSYYENQINPAYINESTADEWLKDGSSKEMEPFGNTQYKKIICPDWHSPSWCTTEEMKECIYDLFWNKEKQCWVGDYVEWLGLLGAMEGIEKDGNYECRAVFWFDN